MDLLQRTVSLLQYSWITWVLVWVGLALWRKPVRQRAGLWVEFSYRVVGLAAALLMIWRGAHVPLWLAHPLYKPDLVITTLGLLLAWLGFATTFWARFALGGNWSPTVVVKDGHELIRKGPYALVRHPIYSGVLLALLGTCLALPLAKVWIGAALILVSFSIKARAEERLLAPVFGEKFQDYMRTTGRFVPRLGH